MSRFHGRGFVGIGLVCMYAHAVYLSKSWMQNAAAKVICHIGRFDHITTSLFSLHGLLIRHRIQFKILPFSCKALNGLVPAYITELSVSSKSHFIVYSNGISLRFLYFNFTSYNVQIHVIFTDDIFNQFVP